MKVVVFADPAESQDFCAAVAMSKKHFDFPMVFNEIMESSQFGYELFNFCKYIYNITSMWPKLAVERNVGSATIFVLRQLNYQNMYRMVDFTSGNHYEQGQMGWNTTGSLKGGEIVGTRRKMLDDFAMVLRQGQVKMYDEQQLIQFKNFVVVKGRAQARSSTHDDLVMACYSEDTQVLTGTGWKNIIDVSVGEQIPSLDIATNQVSLATNTFTYVKKYEGEMIQFKGKNIALLTTPNHRMVVAKSKGANEYLPFEIERADALPGKHFRLLNHAKWMGILQDEWIIPAYKASKFHKEKEAIHLAISDFLSLAGFYIAEGCSVGNDKSGYCLVFSQKQKSKGYLPFKQLLDHLGWKYSYNGADFIIYNSQLARYFKELIPGRSWKKRIPREILNLHPDHLGYLYKFLMLGDGCGNKLYITSSEELKDDFMELISRLGWYSTFRLVDDRGRAISCNPKYVAKQLTYVISIGRVQAEPRFNHHGKDQVTKRLYQGNVVCLMLDKNNIMLVRQNGTTCWSGNTCGAYQIHLTTPDEQLDGFDVDAFQREKEKWRFK